MPDNLNAWGVLRHLTWEDVLLVAAVLLGARLLVLAVQWTLHHAAEQAPPRLRLTVLRLVPLVRLAIHVAAVVAVVAILIEPTLRNVVALVGSTGLLLAFALKDYGSSLVAGLVTVLENTYQPGDWIEIDGAYGEVKSIGARALRLLTADDTEVIVPHSRLWSATIANATSGSRSLLCVTDIYLDPDHDAAAARQRLEAIAQASPYRKPDTDVTVIVLEKPWATHYRVKAYVRESREQYLLITDMTVRAKTALRAMNIRFAQVPYAPAR